MRNQQDNDLVSGLNNVQLAWNESVQDDESATNNLPMAAEQIGLLALDAILQVSEERLDLVAQTRDIKQMAEQTCAVTAQLFNKADEAAS